MTLHLVRGGRPGPVRLRADRRGRAGDRVPGEDTEPGRRTGSTPAATSSAGRSSTRSRRPGRLGRAGDVPRPDRAPARSSWATRSPPTGSTSGTPGSLRAGVLRPRARPAGLAARCPGAPRRVAGAARARRGRPGRGVRRHRRRRRRARSAAARPSTAACCSMGAGRRGRRSSGQRGRPGRADRRRRAAGRRGHRRRAPSSAPATSWPGHAGLAGSRTGARRASASPRTREHRHRPRGTSGQPSRHPAACTLTPPARRCRATRHAVRRLARAVPLDVRRTLAVHARGRGDPAYRVDAGGGSLAHLAHPGGPRHAAGRCWLAAPGRAASAQAGAGRRGRRVRGLGARARLAARTTLLPGPAAARGDDRAGFPRPTRCSASCPPGTRASGSAAPAGCMEALVPAVLEQKVVGVEAHRAWRYLLLPVRRARRPGPRPAGMRVPPPAAVWRASRPGSGTGPGWRGCGPAPSSAPPRWPGGWRRSSRWTAAEADRRLRALPGIGVWTSAEVRAAGLRRRGRRIGR